MSKHIVTINSSSLQDSIKFEGCSECQTSCQSACKTSCTIGNLLCTEQEEAEEAEGTAMLPILWSGVFQLL